MIGAGVQLCERCGYDLGGTPVGGRCGECGREVSDSAGARRVGSPWQVRPGLRGLVETVALAYVRPFGDRKAARGGGAWERGLWSVVRVESARSMGLAGAVLVLTPLVAWVGLVSTSAGRGFLGVTPALGFVVNGGALLALLVAIEGLGIQLMGRKNGWRVTPAVAGAVVCHASPAWLTGGLLGAAGWVVGQQMAQVQWFEVPWAAAWAVTSPSFVLALGGLFVGLLHFEVLVYLGVREMRYANG